MDTADVDLKATVLLITVCEYTTRASAGCQGSVHMDRRQEQSTKYLEITSQVHIDQPTEARLVWPPKHLNCTFPF